MAKKKGRESSGALTGSGHADANVPSTSKASTSQQTSSVQFKNGFLAVPVTMPRGSLGKSHTVVHWMYARKHTGSSSGADGVSSASSSSKRKAVEDLPSDRTLFLANLPVDTTESHLRDMFLNAGNLSAIHFRSQQQFNPENGEEDEAAELEEEGGDSDDDEKNTETHHQLKPNKAGKRGKKGKSSPATAASSSNASKQIPKVTPLPSLDPRQAVGSQPFLPTCSSAHLVFLDSAALDRALQLLQKPGGLKWTDPFKDLRKEEAKVQAQAQSSDPNSNTNPNNNNPNNNNPNNKTTTSAAFLLSAGAAVPATGLKFLLEQYQACRPPLEDVKRWADSRISLYQYRKAHPLPRKIGVRGVTVGPNGELLDEDGFTIVQRSGGKYGRSAGSEGGGGGSGSVGIAKRDFQENKNKKSEGLQDFYRFQMREKKRENLAQLRAKFEQDKEKVAKLKASRRFKPY